MEISFLDLYFSFVLEADRWSDFFCLRLSKNKKHVSRPDSVYKKESGRAVFFLLFIISYCMLSLHIITFPQGYVGALRSNINTTKHQILIKHKFV